jgi:hypothetical protein
MPSGVAAIGGKRWKPLRDIRPHAIPAEERELIRRARVGKPKRVFEAALESPIGGASDRNTPREIRSRLLPMCYLSGFSQTEVKTKNR